MARATVQASELTFGVELEVYLPRGLIAVGGRHAGRQIPDLPEGWNAQGDGSLTDAPHGYQGVEVVSPILKGEDGLRQLAAACAWLNGLGAKVTRKCGFHVHVGVRRGDEELVRRVTHLASLHEEALFASTGTRSRKESVYCRPIQTAAAYIRQFRDKAGRAHLERFHTVNVTNILGGSKTTIEFRVFAGTTNATKTTAYVRICLGLVEKAHGTAPRKWAGAPVRETSNMKRSGAGQTELTRLFYYMGWIKGKNKRVYGAIEGEGIASLDACKAELMRLARKYDERDD
jgi:hypothetical protein